MKEDQFNQPNPTQKRILEWVDNIRKNFKQLTSIPVLYIQGGNGSGKTRGYIAPVGEMVTQLDGIRILWGREDFKDLKLSVMDRFFEVLPSKLIKAKNEQFHFYDIEQPNGGMGRIYFNHLKDLDGLGSQEFAVIVVTEAHQITETTYRALKRRCRQAGLPTMILMESEPPNEGHWLSILTNPKSSSYDPDIEMWKLSTRENWDNLPLAYTGSLESMPESAKRKYIEGECGFTPDGTPFYKGFKESLHKKKLNYIPSRPLYRVWDYGYRHPACSFHQIDGKGRWLILKEMMGTDITILEFGNYLKTMCKEWYPGAQWVDYGDPSGEQKTDKSEKTSVEILASLGIFVVSKQSTYRERKEIIERRLSTLIEGIPSLLVDESCKTIIDGFLGGYHYPIRRQNQAYNPNIFEIPYRDGFYEHLMNTIEYFAVNMFEGAETKDDEGEMTSRVVGDQKDVRWEVEDETRYSPAYRNIVRRPVEDEEPSVRYVGA